MYTTYKLTIASIKMFVRNRQALFFSLFVPFMILTIFGLMDFDKPISIKLGLVTHDPGIGTSAFVEQIKKVPSFNVDQGPLDAELDKLKRGSLTAVLDLPDNLFLPGSGTISVPAYTNGSRPNDAQIARSVLNNLANQAAIKSSAVQLPITLDPHDVSVNKTRYIDFLLPGIVAMGVMQMSVFSVAFVFARYREAGILKRILATPVKPSAFVTANIITRLLMAVAQAAIFIVLGMLIFHVQIHGSFALVVLCIIIGSLMFLGLGFTISGLAKTTETVPVLANLTVFPMMFLGGVFFQPGNVPGWLQPVANNLPLTYFAQALRAVMMEGAGFSQIQGNLLGSALWAVGLITLAVITFRLTDPESPA